MGQPQRDHEGDRARAVGGAALPVVLLAVSALLLGADHRDAPLTVREVDRGIFDLRDSSDSIRGLNPAFSPFGGTLPAGFGGSLPAGTRIQIEFDSSRFCNYGSNELALGSYDPLFATLGPSDSGSLAVGGVITVAGQGFEDPAYRYRSGIPISTDDRYWDYRGTSDFRLTAEQLRALEAGSSSYLSDTSDPSFGADAASGLPAGDLDGDGDLDAFLGNAAADPSRPAFPQHDLGTNAISYEPVSTSQSTWVPPPQLAAITPPPDGILLIKASQSVLVGDATEVQGFNDVLLRIDEIEIPPEPAPGNERDDSGAGLLPFFVTFDEDGNGQADLSKLSNPALKGYDDLLSGRFDLDLTPQTSTNVHVDPTFALDEIFQGPLGGFVQDVVDAAGENVLVLNHPEQGADALRDAASELPYVIHVEVNVCRNKLVDDPYYASRGSWGQAADDQWALKQVGVPEVWDALGPDPAPVVVAVIDSGLDWNHKDFAWESLWRNEDEIAGNGVDDDGNGYVDDTFGWDFVRSDRRPWDRDGHGTFVAGVIAATTDNGVGIAGINPHARIMPLRALNGFGHSRASLVAKALFYAADNGARVINLSVGGTTLTRIEQRAIDHARAKGAVVIAAAGNDGADVGGFAPAGHPDVIAVGSTDYEDGQATFSNWGRGIDLVAPGVDVLSLRARGSDLAAGIPELEYTLGDNIVGDDKRYYRATGTSFSAPLVSGVASLLLSKNPQLTGAEVERMLVHSARDVGSPGIDNLSGHGLLDARRALAADPGYYAAARIDGVEVVRDGKATFLRVLGTAEADRIDSIWLEVAPEDDPDDWERVGKKRSQAVRGGELGRIPASDLRGAKRWTIRVIVEHEDGSRREARYALSVG